MRDFEDGDGRLFDLSASLFLAPESLFRDNGTCLDPERERGESRYFATVLAWVGMSFGLGDKQYMSLCAEPMAL